MTRSTRTRAAPDAQDRPDAHNRRSAMEAAGDLERTLSESLDATRALLDATLRHRAAIAAADADAMSAAVRTQGEIVARLGALDARRREALMSWARARRVARDDVTLGMVAGWLDGEREGARAEALRGLGAAIRDVGGRLRREQASVREACQMLMAHGEGLFEQVRRRVSHARTYSRRGSIHVGQSVVSGLDLVR